MFFLQLDKWYTQFAIFGNPNAEHAFNYSSDRLAAGYNIQYKTLEDVLYPPYGQRKSPQRKLDDPPIHVMIGQQQFVGFVSVPPNMLLEEDSRFGQMSLIDLIIHYLKRFTSSEGIPELTFEDWMGYLPIREKQTLPAILRTYDGNYYLIWYSKRSFMLQHLTETCFVRNCKVYPLSELKKQQLQQARKEISVIEERHAELEKHQHELPQHLSGYNGLLRFIQR